MHKSCDLILENNVYHLSITDDAINDLKSGSAKLLVYKLDVEAGKNTGNPPSKKQIKFARKIAQSMGRRLPIDCENSKSKCWKYINDNKHRLAS